MSGETKRIIRDNRLIDEYLLLELSRRDLLRRSSIVALGALIGCQPQHVQPTTAAASNPKQKTAPALASSLVGAGYHASSEAEAIALALQETIGLSMIKPGDSVYLKVNTNSGDPFPYSTSTTALLTVGGMLRDMGVTDIRIGDRSFWGDAGTAANFERNGIAAASRKLGTKAIAFEDEEVEWVALPKELLPDWTGEMRIPKMVSTATHIINMPCVKTHFIATFTMSLKNCLGLIHPIDRKREGNLRSHEAIGEKLGRQIAQMNKTFTPSMNILNGYQALITGGPTPHDRSQGRGADVASPGIVLASVDRIAVDAVGLALLRTLCPSSEEVMQFAPLQNPQIVAAIQAGGLGISSASELSLSGPSVPSLEKYTRALAE